MKFLLTRSRFTYSRVLLYDALIAVWYGELFQRSFVKVPSALEDNMHINILKIADPQSAGLNLLWNIAPFRSSET